MTVAAAPEPRTSTPRTSPDLVARFYDGDAALAESMSSYLRAGLDAGHAALVVVTAEHARQLMERLEKDGLDPAPAIERRQFVVLDAEATLDFITLGGAPDADRFLAKFEPIFAEACRRFGHVVAFGEMVGLLWNRGRRQDAVHLESFWGLLAERYSYDLLLAYSEQGERSVPGAQQRADALRQEIDARVRAERELADFLENAVVGLHRVGPDGTILWANSAELEMLGYEARDYVGRNIAEFHADQELLDRIMTRLAAGDSLRDMPAKLRAKDGTLHHVLISSNALIRDGKIVNTRCFTRDVSDRWLAQEALRERGAVLHLAMQGARMGYWVGDLSRETLRGSTELAGLLGLSGAFEWSLADFLALVHPQDRESFKKGLDMAILNRREFLIEFRVRSDVTAWRWLEGRGEAVYDEHGVARRFYGVCMDVTARKRSEEQLAHMAAVVDSADDAIVSKTLDGIVKSWNNGARRIFGYEPEEIVGRPITVIIPPELHAEEAHILAKIRAGERVEHYVTTRVAKDGTRKKISITVSPVRNAAGEIIGASKIGRVVA
jgi:PAS domain S-box-containing protein